MKNKKKKSFYFEDYTEAELANSNTTKIIKILLSRVTLLSFVFFILMIIFSTKIIYLSLSPEKNFYTDNAKKNPIKKRRDIVDKNGAIMATNVTLYNVGVRPKLLKEKGKKKFIN